MTRDRDTRTRAEALRGKRWLCLKRLPCKLVSSPFLRLVWKPESGYSLSSGRAAHYDFQADKSLRRCESSSPVTATGLYAKMSLVDRIFTVGTGVLRAHR